MRVEGSNSTLIVVLSTDAPVIKPGPYFDIYNSPIGRFWVLQHERVRRETRERVIYSHRDTVMKSAVIALWTRKRRPVSRQIRCDLSVILAQIMPDQERPEGRSKMRAEETCQPDTLNSQSPVDHALQSAHAPLPTKGIPDESLN